MLSLLLDRLWFSSTGTVLRQWFGQLLHLIVPSWCPGCQAPAVGLCSPCRDDFRRQTRWAFRAEEPAEALPVVHADINGIEVLPVLAAAPYQTLVAETVLTFKDHEGTRLCGDLAAALQRAVDAAIDLATQQHPGVEVLLVRIPASRSSLRRRGRDPLGELLQCLRLPGQVRLAEGVLRVPSGFAHRFSGATSHRGLSAGARRQRSAFELAVLPEQIRHAVVVLVDDVVTTGATIARAWEPLEQVQAKVCAAAVVAAAGSSQVRSVQAIRL